MDIKLAVNESESKLIVDLLARSDPMQFYVPALIKKLLEQINDQRCPQGLIQPESFLKANPNKGPVKEDEKIIRALEQEIARETNRT